MWKIQLCDFLSSFLSMLVVKAMFQGVSPFAMYCTLHLVGGHLWHGPMSVSGMATLGSSGLQPASTPIFQCFFNLLLSISCLPNQLGMGTEEATHRGEFHDQGDNVEKYYY
jgi:hypothetical protein